MLLTHCSTPTEPAINYFEVPCREGSGEPNLISIDNHVYLTWIERQDERSRLMFSRWHSSRWLDPLTIDRGKDWFVNWADFPSLNGLNGEELVAHYLKKNGEGLFAYGVNMVFSHDGGETWSEPVIPHETQTETEHGFVSLLPYEGQYFATWLDGRNTSGEHGHGEGSMTLRAGFITPDGTVIHEQLLDERVCDCCQTDAALTADGLLVAYRDRSGEEIRDISVVRYEDGQWSEPLPVSNDNWEIRGCPVNGPALDAKGQRVAVAWYTAANQDPQCLISFSEDGGKTFSKPVRIDSGDPIGRVDLKMNGSNAYVSWMENANDSTFIMISRYSNKGILQNTMRVAQTSPSRASGFPRMALNNNKVFLAWRNIENEPVIRTAVIENL